MKCPKCGYVSFDHNQACPKCNKDISEERNKLNLPDFEPSVPFLLGALTGEADEAGMDIDIAGPAAAAAVEEEIPLLEEEEEVASLDEDLEISLDDDWSTDTMDEEPAVADDLSDFESPAEEVTLEPEEDEDLGLALEDMEEPVAADDELDLSPMEEGGGEEEEISLDLEDLAPDVATPEEPAPADESVLETDEDLGFDLEDLAPEEAAPEEPEAPPSGEAEEDLGLDLEELSLDEDELTGEVTTEDASPTEEEEAPEFDLDSIALDEDEGAPDEPEPGDQDEEVVLNLDDLKVNETGELEIGPQMTEAAEEPESPADVDETTIDLDDIALDEPASEAEPAETESPAAAASDDFTMDLDDLSLEGEEGPVREDSEEELSLDLEDLELDLDLEEEEPK